VLLSTNGNLVNFGDLRGTVPVGLFFYGGDDCTGCDARLSEMQDSYRRFRQAGAEQLTVSTDPPEQTRSTVERLGIESPVLSAVNGSVSAKWGLFNLLGNGHATPSLFVFDPVVEQLASQIGMSIAELPSIDEVLQII
jgi:peroxiredoxin